MTKYIKNNWEIFSDTVISPDAPEIQIEEMRKAFYVGVCMIFNDIHEKLDNRDISEEEGGKFLSEIDDEVIEFLSKAC